MPGAGLFVAILAVLAAAAAVSAEECAVRYANAGSRPLLFGGVLDRCVAGCAARTSQWGKACSFKRENDPKMVCTPSAANRSFALAEMLGGGEAMQLSPCDLVRYLRGRTLWLIGDSHARFFYRALQCFLLDFWDHRECQSTLDDEANAQIAKMPAAPGGAYCFHLLGPATGRVCMVHAVLGTSLVDNPEVAEGGVLPLLHKKFAQPQDIFYINFGIWHKNQEQHEASYLPALEALARFYKVTKARFPHVVFGETPAQHQRTGDGKQCAAARGFSYDPASGLLMTTPAVNAALRSTGGVAASSNANSAAVNPAAAAAANPTAAAVPAVAAAAGTNVTTKTIQVTNRTAAAPANRSVTGSVNVTRAPAAAAAQPTNATIRTAVDAATRPAGRKERARANSTTAAAANGTGVSAANVSVANVSVASTANALDAASNATALAGISVPVVLVGTASGAAAGVAAADADAPVSAKSNISVAAAFNVSATAARPTGDATTRAEGIAGLSATRPALGPAFAAAGNAAAVTAGNAVLNQANRPNNTVIGNVTAPAAGNATVLSVATTTARPAVNASAGSAGGINTSNNAAAATGAADAAVLAANAAATAAARAANAAAAEQAASAYQQAWDLGIVVNQLANDVLSKEGLPLLPFFNITVPLHDNHASIPLFSGKLDCMHYCHPGAPQMWVWYLYDFLRSPGGVQPLPNQANANYTLPCRVMKSAP